MMKSPKTRASKAVLKARAARDLAAIDGDQVTIDIEGSHEGEPGEGLTATDYLSEVGSGAVVAEIDENLQGAAAGDEVEFEAPLYGLSGAPGGATDGGGGGGGTGGGGAMRERISAAARAASAAASAEPSRKPSRR